MMQKPITLIEYPPIISLAKLMKERCWTRELVHRYLRSPNALAVNPLGGSLPPQKVYFLSRVETVEHSAEVAKELKRIAGMRRLRKMIEDGSIELLRETVADDLASLHIDVAIVPIAELECLARREVTEGSDQPSEENLAASDLLRYIRKNLVDYTAIAELVGSKIGPLQLEYLLRDRIEAAVLDAYPQLAAPPAETV